ncbi:MAG: hypothetical protein ACYDDZ_11020 [Acidimicrobiales bacterium]
MSLTETAPSTERTPLAPIDPELLGALYGSVRELKERSEEFQLAIALRFGCVATTVIIDLVDDIAWATSLAVATLKREVEPADDVVVTLRDEAGGQ